jgi:hypothetical protein
MLTQRFFPRHPDHSSNHWRSRLTPNERAASASLSTRRVLGLQAQVGCDAEDLTHRDKVRNRSRFYVGPYAQLLYIEN